MGMGLLRVAERTAEIGATTLQIFTDNPTAWRRREQVPAEAAAFRRLLLELDLGPLAIHAPYLINLAGPDEVLFLKSVDLVRHELDGAPEFGARFVNVHVGSHRGAGLEAGIGRLTDGLALALDGVGSGPEAPMLVLENSSGGGYTIGSRIEELAAVLDAASARGLDGRLGICLDVAHLWGAGYDVASPDAIDRLLEQVDRLLGLECLVMVHFNDSLSARGSLRDHHTHLGEGQIGRTGLAHFLCHPSLAHAAFFMEVPDVDRGYDHINVARLEDLATGRPLTPGPNLKAARSGGGSQGEAGARSDAWGVMESETTQETA
jgi:deoxyribonuclease-4